MIVALNHLATIVTCWQHRIGRGWFPVWVMIAALVGCVVIGGCQRGRQAAPTLTSDIGPHQFQYQQIETPMPSESLEAIDSHRFIGPPPTLSTFESYEPFPMTLDEAVQLTLQNSEVLQKLGGQVIAVPGGSPTIYDPALQISSPQQGVEAALSAFDAQWATNLNVNRIERKFNNIFFGQGTPTLNANSGNFIAELSKTAATGTRFAMRNITDYNRSDSPANRFGSAWDTVMLVEARQPLLRGFGSTVNRIAGPNAQPGIYNGVLIARVRNDIALADFEAGVRNLIRDVEQTYWELYFAYRDLDAKIRAREAARETWQKRKLLVEAGEGRPDDEALARQQYFNFQRQVQDALVGTGPGLPGVFRSERNLRRLTGLTEYNGQLIRPATDPVRAPVLFDWDQAQWNAVERRVELRRQRWSVKQREMELLAARQLNHWRLDLFGNYGFRGFGDNLFGSRDRPEGSAFNDLLQGDLDQWTVGFELQGPIGNRLGNVAVRNASLALARERALLQEQQRQVLLELSDAYAEVDRAYASIATNYNLFEAVADELEHKQIRAEVGEDDPFFLLSAQQQAVQAESAFHRAVADYNVALLNFALTSGELLNSYGIYLSESDWNEDAQWNSMALAEQFTESAAVRHRRDAPPVSLGPHLQTLDELPPVEPQRRDRSND